MTLNDQAIVIALAGKGGTGKTSIAALWIDELARAGYPGPVLAVDGDPAGTLHLALDLPQPKATVGDVRETTLLDAQTIRNLPPGVSRTDYVGETLKAAGVLAPSRRRDMPLDFLALGRSEGPGCYCAINGVLSQVLAALLGQYPLIVIDNEAGLEHLSRVRIKQIDHFWIVANPTRAALAVAEQVLATARDVEIAIGDCGLILNRDQGGAGRPDRLNWLLSLPESETLARLEREGRPVVALPDADPIRGKLSFLRSRVVG